MAILYIVAGLGVAILPLIKTKSAEAISSKQLSPTVYWFLFTLIAGAIITLGTNLFQEVPLDYKIADMLPVIEIMGQRWLAGQDVYARIPEIWETGMQPIYLPSMWLPYTLPIAIGMDMRFMSLFFIISIVFMCFILAKRQSLTLFVLIPLLLLLSYIFIDYSTLITITEEPLVIGFYFLLAFALFKDKPILIIIALSLCLLSRYALLFWALTYIAYTFLFASKSRAILIALGSAICCLFLLYISQGIYQLELFYSLKDAYLETLTNPDEAWGVANITQKNIGIARFLALDQLSSLHKTLFLGSILLPPILFTWYHFFGRHWVSAECFAVCSLKLCLVYFFNMNALPFSYLFYTSTFFSLAIVVCYFSRSKLSVNE